MRAALLAALVLTSCTASRHQLLRLEKQTEENTEAPNTFERCKSRCLERGKRVIESWEDALSFKCHCVPFDA